MTPGKIEAMCNWSHREDRVCCTAGDNFVSRNLKEAEVKRLLRDELEMYSYQFKQVGLTLHWEPASWLTRLT